MIAQVDYLEIHNPNDPFVCAAAAQCHELLACEGTFMAGTAIPARTLILDLKFNLIPNLLQGGKLFSCWLILLPPRSSISLLLLMRANIPI